MRKLFLLPIAAVLLFSCGVLAQQENVKLLPPNAFQQELESSTPKQLIDVRTPQEFQSGHIATAKNINLYDADFKERLEKLDRDQPVYVYCKVGGRSAKAAETMHELGFTHIYDLEGGIMAWESNNLPVTGDGQSKGEQNGVSTADFDKLIADNKVLLIDFYAPWCIPCKEMEPSLNKLAKEYEGKVTFSRIDLDKAKPLARELNIESIPVIAVYKNGKELKRVTGFQSTSQLRKLIKHLLEG